MNLCIVVPHYDHVEQFATVLPHLALQGLPLVIVDDHSPADVFARLLALIEKGAPGAIVRRLDFNHGKGGAVQAGLRAARDAGYSHAVQVDADGQHDLDEIAALAAEAGRHPHAIVCAEPRFGEDMPALRRYARYLTLALCQLETLSREIRDPMCGFRVYPLQETLEICDRARLGLRMDFDPEILVRAVWTGIPLRYLPVRVVYPEHGSSHFLYLQDNLLISWMHTRLIFGMVLRLPELVRRKRRQGKAP